MSHRHHLQTDWPRLTSGSPQGQDWRCLMPASCYTITTIALLRRLNTPEAGNLGILPISQKGLYS
eukprot:3501208-Amphidinium_carterae.1